MVIKSGSPSEIILYVNNRLNCNLFKILYQDRFTVEKTIYQNNYFDKR